MTVGSHNNLDEFARFMQYMDRLFRAFSTKYLEGLNTVLLVLDRFNVSVEAFRTYVNATTILRSLEARGYFERTVDVEKAKAAKEIERSIPDPVLRKFARKLRLGRTTASLSRSG